MSISIPRRIPAILAGFLVLVLTAGAAFAGQPTETPVDGLAIAAERSGLQVPIGGTAPTIDDEEELDEGLDEEALDEEELDEEELDEEEEETDEAETDEAETDEESDVEADEELGAAGSHCVDPETLTVEVLAVTNHGAIVCWAAHQDAPDGYDNHGQYVSEWAKKDHGSEATGLRAAKGKGKAKGR